MSEAKTLFERIREYQASQRAYTGPARTEVGEALDVLERAAAVAEKLEAQRAIAVRLGLATKGGPLNRRARRAVAATERAQSKKSKRRHPSPSNKGLKVSQLCPRKYMVNYLDLESTGIRPLDGKRKSPITYQKTVGPYTAEDAITTLQAFKQLFPREHEGLANGGR